MTPSRITINGEHIIDIRTFYKEINSVFMETENWHITESLDALNDIFYGGIGILTPKEPVQIVWTYSKKSQKCLGLETTLDFYNRKLENPERFNSTWAKKQIEALLNGSGKTYFDIIVEIITDQPHLELILE